MKIDKNKVIKKDPMMICDSCFKENCQGECWFIIRFSKWLKRKLKINYGKI